MSWAEASTLPSTAVQLFAYYLVSLSHCGAEDQSTRGKEYKEKA